VSGVPAVLFPTMLVGSYPQPEWLIERDKLAHTFPPRVRAKELWRIPEEHLAEAQDDATIMAIKAQEEAGLDVISDGEIRRESYSNLFANALDGLDLDNPGVALDRGGNPNPVPRVVGPIGRSAPIGVRDLQFLLSHTDRPVKVTVPGPFTMTKQAQNDFYPDLRATALAYAAVVNAEIKDLFAAGAAMVQIDEPYMQAFPTEASEWGVDALNRAFEGIDGETVVHVCFGYAALVKGRPSAYSFLPELANCRCRGVSIETAQSKLDCSVLAKLPGKRVLVGVLDLNDMNVEAPETVAERLRRALAYVPAELIVAAPDCGMKYLPREVAFGKMQALVAGAQIMREEVAAAAAR
jgi:5-methyltetrahydropteroyltriglutamate--homocysteine methyltransferase